VAAPARADRLRDDHRCPVATGTGSRRRTVRARARGTGTNGTGVMRQRYTERSNVAVVDELVGLILAQRNYEVNSRAIRASDEMLQQTNQLIR